MPEARIIAFDKSDQSHIDAATALFKACYGHFHAIGIQLPLAPDGEKLWMASALQSVNRLSILPLAVVDEKIVGFAQGTIKLLPDYLGAHKVGVVQHVYVDEAYQRRGIAEALVQALQQWFTEKQVHSVELQVVSNNEKATAFWKKMGFVPELSQWRMIS